MMRIDNSKIIGGKLMKEPLNAGGKEPTQVRIRGWCC